MKLLPLALTVLGASLTLAGDHDPAYYLNHINPAYMVAIDDVQKWHAVKDALGPSFSGTPSWKMQMMVIETKLRDYGAVDIQRNNRKYNRWSTSFWPDDSNWTLVSNGKPVRVASFGANSGSTPEQGTNADLIYYDPANPPASIEGKIVVYVCVPEDENTPVAKRLYIWPGDYMYLSSPETFPDPRVPRKLSMAAHLRSEMQQANNMRQKADRWKKRRAQFSFISRRATSALPGSIRSACHRSTMCRRSISIATRASRWWPMRRIRAKPRCV